MQNVLDEMESLEAEKSLQAEPIFVMSFNFHLDSLNYFCPFPARYVLNSL